VNKQLRLIVVLAVLVNITIVGWLLLQPEGSEGSGTTADKVKPLFKDNTMESARYDLSDQAKDLNIILISMDALRWDRTGVSGNKDGLTPNLDQLSEEAVVFHQATSAAPWTLPSHMSVWTGRWPSVHQVTNKLRPLSGGQMVETSLSAGIETYPDLLIRSGRKAAGFTGGAGVQGKYGFSRGFDSYLDDRYFAGMDYSIPPALSWLKAHTSTPFFLFLHGYDVHGQYDLPRSALDALRGYDGALDGSKSEQAKLREQGLENIKKPGDPAHLHGTLDDADAAYLAQVYDGKVRLADERLGSFLSQLKALGLYDRSVIILMSDHGDEFMEHGGLDHGASLYQEQLHVAMMIRFPGYGRRQDIHTPVRTLDIFPTVFAALGLDGPSTVDGMSLLPLMRGQSLDLPVFAESDYRLFVHLRMLREGKYKLILDLLDGKRELYDLEADPGEKRDLSSGDPRRTYEMEQALRKRMDASKTNPQDYLGLEETPISIF
jgi:arylsulfatase A-like enzyme